jgi:hypothetical protein
MKSCSFLECIVVVTCPYCKYHYTLNAKPWPSEDCWRSGRAEEVVRDCEGVGSVKRETNVNPNQSRVLSKCMLLSHVHDVNVLRAQNGWAWWTEYFEVRIGAVSSETYVSTVSWHITCYLRQVFKSSFYLFIFLVQSCCGRAPSGGWRVTARWQGFCTLSDSASIMCWLRVMSWLTLFVSGCGREQTCACVLCGCSPNCFVLFVRGLGQEQMCACVLCVCSPNCNVEIALFSLFVDLDESRRVLAFFVAACQIAVLQLLC